MSGPLDVEDVGAVRVLTLSRPQARNALDGELISAFYTALDEADDDATVRAVVLTGSDPAFCAGVDLKQAAAEGPEYFARFDRQNCVARVAEMRTPVVGAVNGAAFTGGLEIALGCDFLVASERAVFADTHVRVGVLPGGGLTARLPRLVGAGWARRMSMTGVPVDAETAARIGLVTEVVPHERLRDRALELATAIAEVAPAPMAGLKQIYVRGGAPLLAPALEAEHEISGALMPDAAEIGRNRAAVTERNRRQLGLGEPDGA